MAQNRVFCYFFKFSSLVFVKITQDDSLEHCLDKTLEKSFQGPKLGSKIGQGFLHFLKVPLLVFPDIVQDCRLGQCLTASRTETSKKKMLGQNWGRNYLFYSNVAERLLKLASFIKCFITYFCVSGGKKYPLLGKFGVLCLLVTIVLRFSLLPYYRQNYHRS